jgi:hypothetical protein
MGTTAAKDLVGLMSGRDESGEEDNRPDSDSDSQNEPFNDLFGSSNSELEDGQTTDEAPHSLHPNPSLESFPTHLEDTESDHNIGEFADHNPKSDA